jgi:hypothetical protein
MSIVMTPINLRYVDFRPVARIGKLVESGFYSSTIDIDVLADTILILGQEVALEHLYASAKQEIERQIGLDKVDCDDLRHFIEEGMKNYLGV